MKRPPHTFTALNMSLSFLRLLRPLVDAVGKHDRSLKDQLRRAGQSIHLNLSESRGLRGGHRRERLRTALGSGYETRGALEAAEAFGYVEGHKVEVAFAALDELLAVLYRLAMPRS